MMRVDVIQHEIGAMDAKDVAAVAVAAIERIGELGLEGGDAFRETPPSSAVDFEEGMAQIEPR